jgi:hypothetical protein
VQFLILALFVAAALVGVVAYAQAKTVGRCSQCGGLLLASTPRRSCVTGHKLHLTCVERAMDRDELNREVCPICGIYVTEFARSANPVVSGC